MNENRETVLLTFFIPCLNEAPTIISVLEMLDEVGRRKAIDFEIIVVDDGSTDDSNILLARVVQEGVIPLRLVTHSANLGMGVSYRHAAMYAKGRFIMMVGADASEDTTFLDHIVGLLLEKVSRPNERFDGIQPYFIDSRTTSRRLLSKLFASLVRGLSGLRFRYFNGPTVHRTRNVLLFSPTSSGFGFQAEMLVLIALQGAKYIECRLKNVDRQYGSSRAFKLRNFLSVGKSLLLILLMRIKFFFYRTRAVLQLDYQ